MRACAALIPGILLAAGVAFSQHPNLTGGWQRGDARNAQVYSIDQQDSVLNVAFKSEYEAGSLVGGLSWSESYRIDGLEKHDNAANGRETWTTVNWQGASLVVLRVAKAGYKVTVTRDTWSLSADGQTLTRTRRTIDMDGVAENVESFQRR
jgi:hypothetical protein